MMKWAVYKKLAVLNEMKWMDMDVVLKNTRWPSLIHSALVHHTEKAGMRLLVPVFAGSEGLKWLFFCLLLVAFILISAGEL